MLYLIDANVIIDAKDTYYEIDRVPQYWDWLLRQGTAGKLKMPAEMFDEVSPGRVREDPFYIWRKDPATAAALVLEEDADLDIVQRVLTRGYGADLTEDELIVIGKDPFLVAYALAAPERIVVTSEVSKRTQRREKAKLPDVCDDLGVEWIDEFDFIRALDFRIDRVS